MCHVGYFFEPNLMRLKKFFTNKTSFEFFHLQIAFWIVINYVFFSMMRTLSLCYSLQSCIYLIFC